MAVRKRRADPAVVEISPPYDAEAVRDAAAALCDTMRRYSGGEGADGFYLQPPVGR